MCRDVRVSKILLSFLYLSNVSSEYLQANSLDSLSVLVLHEMGNLQFYNGNLRLEICFIPYVCMCVYKQNLLPFIMCIYYQLQKCNSFMM